MGNPKAFLTIGRKEAGYRRCTTGYTIMPKSSRRSISKTAACRLRAAWTAGCRFATGPVRWVTARANGRIWPGAGRWEEAYRSLAETDDFPEFTGRVCPALCEKSCVLKLHDAPVTIRENEVSIVERAFAEGYVTARPPRRRTGKRVAVVGSGPSGRLARTG